MEWMWGRVLGEGRKREWKGKEWDGDEWWKGEIGYRDEETGEEWARGNEMGVAVKKSEDPWEVAERNGWGWKRRRHSSHYEVIYLVAKSVGILSLQSPASSHNNTRQEFKICRDPHPPHRNNNKAWVWFYCYTHPCTPVRDYFLQALYGSWMFGRLARRRVCVCFFFFLFFFVREELV